LRQRKPDCLCDRCIAAGLSLGSVREAHQVIGEFATTDLFQKGHGTCVSCGAATTVTKAI